MIVAVGIFAATILWTIIYLHSSPDSESDPVTRISPVEPPSGISAFFSSLRTPFSIFPPNAMITLTHDNTTAFLARPAAFGPLLPSIGLKGQLWIGSGFGDDNLRQGAVAATAEGELGCSDVPGWEDSYSKSKKAPSEASTPAEVKAVAKASKTKSKRANDEDSPFDEDTIATSSKAQDDGAKLDTTSNDGTDDYLHHPLHDSTVSKSTDKALAESNGDHADIQSIQEGAEIAGKVVLLSRGGCGFLEKVKWAQRRGAIALIVGDDTPGGPLVQMFARGDTSNVSIPAIFTSHTTAHLLSSLIDPRSYIEDSIDENGKPMLKVQHSGKPRKASKKVQSRPTFTPTTSVAKATSVSKAASKPQPKKQPLKSDANVSPVTDKKLGWFKALFLAPHKKDSKSESSRPPSSGQLDWVLVDDWRDDGDSKSKKISTKPSKSTAGSKNAGQKSKLEVKNAPGDDFVIGVQDWRDPDLVGSSAEEITKTSSTKDAKIDSKTIVSASAVGKKKHLGGALQEIPEYVPGLRGGSITPGSGEYTTKLQEKKSSEIDDTTDAVEQDSKSKSLLTTIFGDDEEKVEILTPVSQEPVDGDESMEDEIVIQDDENEGLWVTLTPASGASPFLDTLLVLVVSPLVTLTVVYAMLLIRSRIRRRRWRAPKSVVERLPVRTYQTIASGSQSPRLPSPTSSSASTPLLQQSPTARPRPRSRTTTGIPEPGDLARVNSNPLQVPALPVRSPGSEKNVGEGEWRKHMNKQTECVVCLEEYIDGVSRVMSLPCGHEFHVDCM